MARTDHYNDPNAPKATNIVVAVTAFVQDEHGRLLMIRRTDNDLYSIPGGMQDVGETIGHTVIREVKEETGLDCEIVELFHVYSDPSRDKRKHTVSTVFIGRAKGTPVGSDDAARAIVCKPDALPQPLVFDHPTIVADYVAYKQRGVRPPPRR